MSSDVIFVIASDLFSQRDKNGDGVLDKSEIEVTGVKWSELAAYDLNSTYYSRPEVRIRKTAIINIRTFYF